MSSEQDPKQSNTSVPSRVPSQHGDVPGSSIQQKAEIGRDERTVHTGGGDYAEGSIDKREGTFVDRDQFNFQGDFRGANINFVAERQRNEIMLPSPPQPDFVPPYPLQANFTGRVLERQMLGAWLRGNTPLLALVAIGGMGKSALTWAWLQHDVLGQPLLGTAAEAPEITTSCRVPEEVRPEAVLWWSFYESGAHFEAFLNEAIAYASGRTIDARALSSTHDKVRMLLDQLQSMRLLLMLDGFERELRVYANLNAAYQPDSPSNESDVRECTNPHAANFLRWAASTPLQGKIVLTSRLLPKDPENLAGYTYVELKTLSPDDAVTFFQQQGVRGTRAEIKAACAPYGYHALALRLLAGLIVKDRRTPGDIRVASRHPVLPELKGKEKHHILQVAYDTLNEPDRLLLSKIAAFRSPIPYETLLVLNDYDDEQQFNAALDELEERGLLFRHKERYDLHPVVRGYAYDRLVDKAGVHTHLRNHFAAIPDRQIAMAQSIEDLIPAIELYYHTAQAGLYDDALDLYSYRLRWLLYMQFSAYQQCIEMLEELFSKDQRHVPLVTRRDNRSRVLNELAIVYEQYGNSRQAAELLNQYVSIGLETDVGLINLSESLIKLGRLAEAESALNRASEESSDINLTIVYRQLGYIFLIQGDYNQSSEYLGKAYARADAAGHTQRQGVIAAYQAFDALLKHDYTSAFHFASKAYERAEADARETYPVERDFIRAYWLLGVALVRAAEQNTEDTNGMLKKAETYLTEALTRCRKTNLTELEPDILLAWARWQRLKGDPTQSREYSVAALAIAERCEYRLKQADCHNLLALLALDLGDHVTASKHANSAKERAWCDGPLHCYKPALDEAERLLGVI